MSKWHIVNGLIQCPMKTNEFLKGVGSILVPIPATDEKSPQENSGFCFSWLCGESSLDICCIVGSGETCNSQSDH